MLLDAPGGRAALAEKTSEGNVLHHAIGGCHGGSSSLPPVAYGLPLVTALPSRAALVEMLLPPRPRRHRRRRASSSSSSSAAWDEESGEGEEDEEGKEGEDGAQKGEGEEQDGSGGGDKTQAAAAPRCFCDVNVPDAEGRTPAYVAVARGDVATLRLLLDHGADPAARAHDDNTLLHKAVEDARARRRTRRA